jgi:hypothetical protein
MSFLHASASISARKKYVVNRPNRNTEKYSTCQTQFESTPTARIVLRSYMRPTRSKPSRQLKPSAGRCKHKRAVNDHLQSESKCDDSKDKDKHSPLPQALAPSYLSFNLRPPPLRSRRYLRPRLSRHRPRSLLRSFRLCVSVQRLYRGVNPG